MRMMNPMDFVLTSSSDNDRRYDAPTTTTEAAAMDKLDVKKRRGDIVGRGSKEPVFIFTEAGKGRRARAAKLPYLE